MAPRRERTSSAARLLSAPGVVGAATLTVLAVSALAGSDSSPESGSAPLSASVTVGVWGARAVADARSRTPSATASGTAAVAPSGTSAPTPSNSPAGTPSGVPAGPSSGSTGSTSAGGSEAGTPSLHGETAPGASVLAGRARVLSRDSRRVAREVAQDEQLQSRAEKQARARSAALVELADQAEKQAGEIAANAWSLPVTAGSYHLTSRFGECSGLWSRCHTGLDFAAPSGTPIHAIASGTVTQTGYEGAYGNRTIETLEDRTELWYCHQTSFSVSVGQRVAPGEVIGSVGSTGNVTGPHVHVEVRPSPDHPVDPYAVLLEHHLRP